MSINSQRKGSRGEREAAKFLKSLGYDVERVRQYKGSPDSPDLQGLEGYYLEVKRCQRLNPYGWLHKATEEAEELTPIVLFRRNREDWCVLMWAEDYFNGSNRYLCDNK